jgi:hypothetical protein
MSTENTSENAPVDAVVIPPWREAFDYMNAPLQFEREIQCRPHCEHKECRPYFDPVAAKSMTDAQVRKAFPRFQGTCPECNQFVISYASSEHYVAGDW